MSECCIKNDATGLAAIRTKTEPIKTNDIVPLNLCVGDGSSKNEHARPGNLDSPGWKVAVHDAEPAKRGEVRLRFLGSGDNFGSGGRFQACIHIDAGANRFLLDCGASSLIAMKRAGISTAAVDVILISHLHGDHFGGIPFFILDAQLISRREAPSSSPVPRLDAARQGGDGGVLSRFFGGREEISHRLCGTGRGGERDHRRPYRLSRSGNPRKRRSLLRAARRMCGKNHCLFRGHRVDGGPVYSHRWCGSLHLRKLFLRKADEEPYQLPNADGPPGRTQVQAADPHPHGEEILSRLEEIEPEVAEDGMEVIL